MTIVFNCGPRSMNWKPIIPLNPDDPVSQFILTSKKTPEQRKDELATAAKIGVAAPGRMGKGWPAR